MKINPNTLDLCREYLNKDDIHNGSQYILRRECLLIEKDDYKKAVELLKKHKKIDDIDWWNERYNAFNEEKPFEFHFSAYDLLSSLKDELMYRKKHTNRYEVNDELDANFGSRKVIKTHLMISDFVELKRIQDKVSFYTSFENLEQYLTDRPTEEQD